MPQLGIESAAFLVYTWRLQPTEPPVQGSTCHFRLVHCWCSLATCNVPVAGIWDSAAPKPGSPGETGKASAGVQGGLRLVLLQAEGAMGATAQKGAKAGGA